MITEVFLVNESSTDILKKAAALLQNGELVAIPTETVYGLGANALYEGNIVLSLLIEVILTFVFVIAILGVTSKKENGAVSGIVIGLTLTLVHILGISFTGTSVNPARSFGPALFVGGEALANVWVFIVAPLIGGVLAAVVYNFLDSKNA